MKAKYKKALEALYTENKVGKTYKKKHEFWINKYPNSSISHFTDDKRRVWVYERVWLLEEFPGEHHCY